MSHFDVFNGDADGICALHQLRMSQPRPDARCITGLKRDIALLRRVPASAGDSVTVMDVSLERNREALHELLARGAQVEYFDHHNPGALPRHPRLTLHIDTAAQACTSLLVDRHLGGAHRAWAVVGAFGDNMGDTAHALAASLGLSPAQQAQLRELGEAINYNAYGERITDPLLPPEALYEIVRRYADPFELIAREPVAKVLPQRLQEDLAQAQVHPPWRRTAGGVLYLLPNEGWARRVLGSYAHALARAAPRQAHAVLRADGHRGYVVSVRAPQAAPQGADTLCRRFPTGGGRAAAAGIDQLPEDKLEAFVTAFAEAFAPLH